MAYIDSSRFGLDEKTMEMGALAFAGFLVPFILSGPQLFLGALINALLIRSAYALPGKKAIPVIMAPSIGAVFHGALFGPFTIFLIYLMPAVWIGNGLLVYVYRMRQKQNYFLTLLFASGLKAGLLFSLAWMLYSASIIPAAFLASMGLLQFSTAVLGGIAARTQEKI